MRPGSRTPQGEYVFAAGHRPQDVKLADCPDAFASLLGGRGDGKRTAFVPSACDQIPSGQRNATLLSLAGTMRHRGMGEDAIYAALCVTKPKSSASRRSTMMRCTGSRAVRRGMRLEPFPFHAPRGCPKSSSMIGVLPT